MPKQKLGYVFSCLFIFGPEKRTNLLLCMIPDMLSEAL